MAKMLNIDHLVVLRCAPNGSAMNKVERGMSVLNLPLAHAAIMRGNMAPWAEDAAKGANSTATICTITAKSDKVQGKVFFLDSIVAGGGTDCFDRGNYWNESPRGCSLVVSSAPI